MNREKVTDRYWSLMQLPGNSPRTGWYSRNGVAIVIPGYESLDAFWYTEPTEDEEENPGNLWYVVEGQSGLSLADFNFEAHESISEIIYLIGRQTAEKLDGKYPQGIRQVLFSIEVAIQNYGLSPRYGGDPTVSSEVKDLAHEEAVYNV